MLYCVTGVRAERAIARLQENGFTRLLHLDGDMAKWREAKRTVEKWSPRVRARLECREPIRI